MNTRLTILEIKNKIIAFTTWAFADRKTSLEEKAAAEEERADKMEAAFTLKKRIYDARKRQLKVIEDTKKLR